MKITFISTLLSKWGGSEVLWVQCVEKAVLEGHQVQVVVFAQKDGYHSSIEKIKKISHSFIAIPNPINRSGYFSKALASFTNKVFPFKPEGVIEFKPDTILVNQPDTYSSAFNSTIASILNVVEAPFYIFSHFNSDYDVLSYPDIIKAKSILNKAKALLFVSQRNLDVAKRQLASSLENASVIGNHPNINTFDLLDFPSIQGTIQFASVARLEAQLKGQHILLHIFSNSVWANRQWVLNFYGTGPDETYLKELAKYYNIQQKVIFHGHVADVKQIWKSNHLLLMPSIGEGKPLALEEAMACGRVAVVSDVAGNKELVENGLSGFIASSYFLDPFAEALENAWALKNQWGDMGIAARTKIIDTIDINPQETLLRKLTEG